jgi:hypothetical protein
MQGHAVMMQSHDMIATPIDRCKDQPIGVQVFVRIAELLDQVIGLYRPNCNFDEIPAGEFTSFEDILKQSSATGLPMHLMGMSPAYKVEFLTLIPACRDSRVILPCRGYSIV